MSDSNETAILRAWQRNATPWTRAVREGAIASRVNITDKAIRDVVLACRPSRVLDIGCGEGWLAHQLSEQSIAVVGVDAVAELVEQARQRGGRFEVAAYHELLRHFGGERFDLAVCNFSLLGNESVEQLFEDIPQLLHPGGWFLVQTLHPEIACGERPYENGWRDGSWAGIPGEFDQPAPWYFRTLEAWQALFHRSRLTLTTTITPKEPETEQPVSVIFVARYE